MRYVLFLLLLSGCGVGVPPLVQQEIESNLVQPVWPVTQEGFSLTGDGNQLNMKGSLLIWDELISVADVERLSSASLEKKRQSVNYERISQSIATERKRLRDTLPTISAQRQQVEHLHDAAYTRARETNLAEWQRRQQEHWNRGVTWLPLQLEALAAIDQNWVRRHTEQVLRSYCEGKIFALAVSENLLRRKYLRRPTAHIMCESYYHELFDAKPACQETSDGQGRDYFQCIWQHGVLASAYFAEHYATVTEQQEEIAALRQLLTTEPQRLKQRILDAYDKTAQRRHLKFYNRLGRIGFGDRSVTVRPRKGQPFILQLVQGVEAAAQLDEPTSLPAGRRLFLNPTSSAVVAEKRSTLVNALQALAKSVSGTSVSDYGFNRDIAQPRLAAAAEGDCVQSGILSRVMEFLCNLRHAEKLLPQVVQEMKVPILEDDQLVLTSARKLLLHMQREYDNAIDALEKRDIEAFDLYSRALDTAANVVRGDNMAQALFADARLQIVKTDEQYAINFKLLERDKAWLTTCVSISSGDTAACTDLTDEQVENAAVFSASYVGNEGRLDLRFDLQQPEVVGFDYLDRDSDTRDQDRISFCDLEREQFTALQLHMKTLRQPLCQSARVS